MPMSQQEIQTLRDLMEYEATRESPPDGFPHLPDIPAGRYVDQRFFDLELQHIWRKSWLLAAHIDELPDPGCFLLWENAGQPVLLIHGDDGVINAFYNTCSHRGAPVVTARTGQKKALCLPLSRLELQPRGRFACSPRSTRLPGTGPIQPRTKAGTLRELRQPDIREF